MKNLPFYIFEAVGMLFMIGGFGCLLGCFLYSFINPNPQVIDNIFYGIITGLTGFALVLISAIKDVDERS